MLFRIDRDEAIDQILDESDLDVLSYEKHWKQYRLRLNEKDLKNNLEIIKDELRIHRNALIRYISRFHTEIPDHGRLKITEIMPFPRDGNSEFEYVELVNPSTDAEVEARLQELRALRVTLINCLLSRPLPTRNVTTQRPT